MQTFDGLAWDDKIGWYDPQLTFCIDCGKPAVMERLVGMYEDNFVTEWVCEEHGR